MKAGYFTLETTGPHHDRDSIISLEAIMFDHAKNQIVDRLRYDVVKDLHIVNEMTLPAHEAAHVVKEWFLSDCYYFSLNVDKGKHFLRSFFFYQYLNPFDHEKCGRQNKLLDTMSVLRAAHHIGELPIELPVSPLGEISYEMKAIGKLNFPGLGPLEVMARVLDLVFSSGGKAFGWIKSQEDKKSLYLKGCPLIYLKAIDKEIDSIPKVIFPIGQSSFNRNRFYFYEPSELIRSPMDALEKYLVRKKQKELGGTYRQSADEVIYLDTNKSDLVVGLDEVTERYRLDHLWVYRPSKKKRTIRSMLSLYQKIEEVDGLYKRDADGTSFYEANMRPGYISRWEGIRDLLLSGNIEQAFSSMGNEGNKLIERRRVESFLAQSGHISTTLDRKVDYSLTP